MGGQWTQSIATRLVYTTKIHKIRSSKGCDDEINRINQVVGKVPESIEGRVELRLSTQ